MSPSDARTQAVAESRFFAHLGAFAVGTCGLLGVNLLLGPDPLWAAYVGVAWGLVVASHGAAVFRGVRGEAGVARRAAALADDPTEAARLGSAPDALDRLADRVVRLEARPVALPAPPRDDALARLAERVATLEAARTPGPLHAAFDDGEDPFGDVRQPVETPRLDGPPRRR